MADLGGGRTEVFWGHAKSLKEADGKKAPLQDAARQRGWVGYIFEVVELTESLEQPGSVGSRPSGRIPRR